MDGNLAMANHIVNQTEEQALTPKETEEYLGYIIRKSNDPWMLNYNMPFEYFHPDGEGRVYGAGSIEEAKESIDSKLEDFLERLDKTAKAL